MKKTYISPELLIVQLRPATAILTVSDPDVGITSSEFVNAASVDAKGITDVNVWDDEW